MTVFIFLSQPELVKKNWNSYCSWWLILLLHQCAYFCMFYWIVVESIMSSVRCYCYWETLLTFNVCFWGSCFCLL